MIKKPIFLFLIPLIMCLDSHAQDSKAWLDRVATEPAGPYKKIRPMRVEYTLSWKGKINAGKMAFNITEPYPGIYLSQGSGKSVGVARALFPYDFWGKAQTNAETLKPLTFNFNDQQKKKAYKYSIQFEPNQMISETKLTDRSSGQVTPYRRVWKFEDDIGLDLISSLLYLRSHPLKKGQKFSLITATFNKPYLTEYTVLGRESKSLKGREKFPSIKMDVQISKIHANMTTEPYSKVDRCTVWISDDQYRIPIEFQGEIFVGYICAQLTDRKFL